MNKRKILAILSIVLIFASFSAAAATDDMTGKILQEIKYDGLVHISSTTVDDAIFSYIGKQYTDDLFLELVGKLYDIEGVSYIDIASDFIADSGNISVNFTFHEIPTVSSITFTGNSKVKTKDIQDGIKSVASGSFFDATISSKLNLPVSEISAVYKKKGFETVDVIPSYTEDQAANTVSLSFEITEGVQQRVVEIAFEGNSFAKATVLNAQVSSKVKSLFNAGYLDKSTTEQDSKSIVGYYQKNGFIDALVTDIRYEVIEPDEGKKPKDYQEIKVVFVIDEGLQWKFGGLDVTGNAVFSDDEIDALVTMEPGSVDNLETLSLVITSITDLYYNDGYIYMSPSLNEQRDDQNLEVKYTLSLVENGQASVSKIVFNGLEKTKEYVFKREVQLKEGQVFSKADLITSYQNLYNTGLLTNLSYKLDTDPNGKDVIVEFDLTEGKQMDIQFGATFGGNVSGFPVSGFLKWNDGNLAGTGRDLAVSTTLSPDTQSVELSLGDDWFGNKRWSNKIALSFSRSSIDDDYQVGLGSKRDDGKADTYAYPLGYSSYEAYKAADFASPDSNYLMKYNLLSFSLGYTTGYTFVFQPGRLGFSSGLSIGLNRAYYDKAKYNPFEELIFKYGQRWQFSNKLSLGFQWDGRDLVYYTTKGYVLSQTFTYAGGLLGGLSNYIKSVSSAAGYIKLFGITNKENVTNNCVLSVSSTFSMMLPQFSRKDSVWSWKAASEGATKYEMLYIDGMTIARGFDVTYGFSMLWDNSVEVSYPIVRDVLNFELFTTATAGSKTLENATWNNLGWYFAGGAGVKLKIAGFPLGLYIVKDATFNVDKSAGFAWDNGSLFGGTKLVLAISTSLI